MKTIGFDNDKYVEKQSENILKRVAKFQDKLYIEFGGKLFDDYHAARVLPGFVPSAKIQVMRNLKDKVEIVICVSSKDIERNKIRADIGIAYDSEVLRMITELRKMDLVVNNVVITMYNEKVNMVKFQKQLEEKNVNLYIHNKIEGYPTDVAKIVSDKGFGSNPHIKTTCPIVIVTAPGPGSGKLATCLSQLYHEHRNGVKAGYAKFETFPVWDLPLNHMVNIAYEAATIDLQDQNMIDLFHKSKYGVETVNYNRDIETFPVIFNILKRITGEELYYSPTDMGVNMVKQGIFDNDAVTEAAKQETIRRYYKAICDVKTGDTELESLVKMKSIIEDYNIDINDRKVVGAALQRESETGRHAIALQLHNGVIITGRQNDLMSEGASCVINCLKHLANIPDHINLIPQHIFESIQELKDNHYTFNKCFLNISDVLIAISVQSRFDENAKAAIDKLDELRDTEAHATVMQGRTNSNMFRNLGIRLTCEPEYDLNN